MHPEIEIIYQDSEILVCRKPAGIPVQTARIGQADMVSLLKNACARRQEPLEIYPVHRLDQPVEGIMVFARNSKAAAALSKQIQQKHVDKYYYAVVEGIPQPEYGELRDYLLRDGRTNTSKVVTEDTKGAKMAALHYQVLATTEIQNFQAESGIEEAGKAEASHRSLVKIKLETGRHHQIRVQMTHAGYPLTGDKKYNPSCQRGYLPIGLCSVGLAFTHPVTGKGMEFTIAPRGEAFADFLEVFS